MERNEEEEQEEEEDEKLAVKSKQKSKRSKRRKWRRTRRRSRKWTIRRWEQIDEEEEGEKNQGTGVLMIPFCRGQAWRGKGTGYEVWEGGNGRCRSSSQVRRVIKQRRSNSHIGNEPQGRIRVSEMKQGERTRNTPLIVTERGEGR